MSDDEVLQTVAPMTDRRWRELFAMPAWSDPESTTESDIGQLLECLYGLSLVVPFGWPDWYLPDRFPCGRGLESAPVADSVRLTTALSRADRVNEGALLEGIIDGSVSAAIDRLWGWYRASLVGDNPFVDHSEYSNDGVYRWLYERRWAPGSTLCWVGLNPGTGDSDSGPRPTLGRVVSWAEREGCSAVVVVNLFSFRSTDPRALRHAAVDIVGERTDEVIRAASRSASITLAAWGGNKVIGNRSAEVLQLLDDPVCAGVTKKGEPRHPLYVAAATPLTPYSPEALAADHG